ncbi:MAG: 50S ribosomal protein L6 [Holosporaceae bacterium]|jgi:large subunit ribosomal protein L6|nr:50S ribosomal protein L6 [Holosporaceae bacterium]
MSRVGKHHISIPAGVDVTVSDRLLSFKGKNGMFEFMVHESVQTEVKDGRIAFLPVDSSKVARSMWGTCRAVVANGVKGISELFVKKLNLVGVGYKASVQGKNLVMQLGFSHDIVVAIPDDLKITCETPTVLAVTGSNRQRVGEFAKQLQKYRKPEPYKGKGVLLEGQYVYRKEGKKK